MDANRKPVKYLKLKEFLARNPCVKPRTFTRWKRRGVIDFIQPGGPNTGIFVPEDALERIKQSAQDLGKTNNKQRQSKTASTSRSVRQPAWKQQLSQTQTRKGNNAKTE